MPVCKHWPTALLELKKILSFDSYTCLGFGANMSCTHSVMCLITRAWRHGLDVATHVLRPAYFTEVTASFADRQGIMRLIAWEATWVSKIVVHVVVPITENGTPTIQHLATHPLVYKTNVTQCTHFIKFDKSNTATKPICCSWLTRVALISTSRVR